MGMNVLLQGDCLKIMDNLVSEGTKVDAIITDPPYGTTECSWDSVIPLEPMWEQLKRIIKPNGAIVMTAQQPFTTMLIASNIAIYRYGWVWDKGYATGYANANRMPMKRYEDICIFYNKLPQYNPQGICAIEPIKRIRISGGAGETMGSNRTENREYISRFCNYPQSMISTKKEKTYHPTGKPVALMEYLIKTYTNEGETVLDFTAGSFTTGVACKNLNRSFIGIEQEEKYFNIGVDRLSNV